MRYIVVHCHKIALIKPIQPTIFKNSHYFLIKLRIFLIPDAIAVNPNPQVGRKTDAVAGTLADMAQAYGFYPND